VKKEVNNDSSSLLKTNVWDDFKRKFEWHKMHNRSKKAILNRPTPPKFNWSCARQVSIFFLPITSHFQRQCIDQYWSNDYHLHTVFYTERASFARFYRAGTKLLSKRYIRTLDQQNQLTTQKTGMKRYAVRYPMEVSSKNERG
jgi:hypothetical protein